MKFSLEAAGRWFLQSGIQQPSGGVARYYRTDLEKNAPVSNEITGYAVSTLFYLHSVTGDAHYQTAGLRSAQFLSRHAWDQQAHTFPFELESGLAYFFDTGIIARGLRATQDPEYLGRAHDAALSLAFDHMGDGVFHPILTLPEKQPLPHEPQWSRNPGCYQLKAALAWLETGDPHARKFFESLLQSSLATHSTFLPGTENPEKVMDRLHAYSYFLEALLFVADRPECVRALAEGLEKAAALLREIAPTFERSDVCAQILRVRLIASHLNVIPLDASAASDEATRVARYQATSSDPRIDGGFWFGSKGSVLPPYVNPVSTGFALQALQLWDDHCRAAWRFELPQLI